MSSSSTPRKIAVVTGTRAEFGLLRSVMRAIQQHPELELRVIAAGIHLLPPHTTIDDVRRDFSIAAIVEMQNVNETGRFSDAASLGRGIAGFARVFREQTPDVVLVLGDRIEAFAAAAAASVAGVRVAHMHGGDRAEGIADEAMRHAITKLAHIHLPATQNSAMRIIAMGEDPQRVHIVGSPAMDGLDDIPSASDRDFAALGSPQIVVLLHPVGDDDDVECERASRLFEAARNIAPTLVLHPNHDPGRNGIMSAIENMSCVYTPDRNHANQMRASSATSLEAARGVTVRSHLPRDAFIGLLRRAKVIVGNSSAGLIECAAIPIPAINIGSRQAGREMPANVVDVPEWDYQTIEQAITLAVDAPPLRRVNIPHPYGDGRTGKRVADLLASFDDAAHSVRKRNAY